MRLENTVAYIRAGWSNNAELYSVISVSYTTK